MDRGIRIAIIIACLLSIGLGLLWDSVIDASRNVLMAEEGSEDPPSMRPDPALLKIVSALEEEAESQANNSPVKPNSKADHSLPAPEHTPTKHDAVIFVEGANDTNGSSSLSEPVGSESSTPTASTLEGIGVWKNCPAELWEFIDPDANTYTVQPGDLGYSVICHRSHRFRFLATAYGLETKDWISANGGSDKIRIGQKIIIPRPVVTK